MNLNRHSYHRSQFSIVLHAHIIYRYKQINNYMMYTWMYKDNLSSKNYSKNAFLQHLLTRKKIYKCNFKEKC